jgi:hypothetical protein
MTVDSAFYHLDGHSYVKCYKLHSCTSKMTSYLVRRHYCGQGHDWIETGLYHWFTVNRRLDELPHT